MCSPPPVSCTVRRGDAECGVRDVCPIIILSGSRNLSLRSTDTFNIGIHNLSSPVMVVVIIPGRLLNGVYATNQLSHTQGIHTCVIRTVHMYGVFCYRARGPKMGCDFSKLNKYFIGAKCSI